MSPSASGASRGTATGRHGYRRALAFTLAFTLAFATGFVLVRALAAVFFLAAGFFAEGLTCGLVLIFTFGFAGLLALPAAGFAPRGWVS